MILTPIQLRRTSIDAWDDLLRKASALESVTCPRPGDAVAASGLRADLIRATPNLDLQTMGVSWRRRVWQCSAGQ